MIDWYGRKIEGEELTLLVPVRPARHAYRIGDRERAPRPMPELFADYRAARLRVAVRDAAGVREWLRGCRYVRDPERFGVRDLWLHPEDFEKSRRGDCEDHALWAWVQLARLGLLARFTVGRARGGHAWVTLYGDDGILIFETTQKDPRYVPKPWDGNPDYLPSWSVDGACDVYWHDAQ
jgi:hypothetical protein